LIGYNIFATLAEAEAAQAADHAAFLAVHPAPEEYRQQTTAWAQIREIVGGGYAYAVCPVGNQGHVQADMEEDELVPLELQTVPQPEPIDNGGI
jgi:hypothetical protein